MRQLFLLLILAWSAHAHSQTASVQTAPLQAAGTTPLDIVKLRMERYNAQQLDAIMALYSEDVAIYTYPDTLIGKGRDHLRAVLQSTFKDSSPVTVTTQIAQGDYVISQERVRYGGTAKQYVSIYEVRDGLIRSVKFIRE